MTSMKPLSHPLVSIRVSIAWPPAEPFENTDTLVLTGSKYYLDLRTFKVAQDTYPKIWRVDWATAGVKEWVGGKDTHRARFVPILNSRQPEGDDLPDEGEFRRLENGDELETGKMYNKESGKVQTYEEVWRRLPVPPSSLVVFLERVDKKAFLGRIGKWSIGWQVLQSTGEFHGSVMPWLLSVDGTRELLKSMTG